jgi:hypothetical protein
MTFEDLPDEARSQILAASTQVPRRFREAFCAAAAAAFNNRRVVRSPGDLRDVLARMQKEYRVAPSKE